MGELEEESSLHDVAFPRECECYTCEELDACALPRWYPDFAAVSIKTHIIPMPEAFVSYLNLDKIVLPSEEEEGEDLEEEEKNDFHEESLRLLNQEHVREFRRQVENCLEFLGGSAFIKLNWSCPQDASWMLGSLKCRSFEDMILLLKSSDFVSHDMNQAYFGCVDCKERHVSPLLTRETDELETKISRPETCCLNLRKWCNFYNSMHFRCFVAPHHRLIAISQRHYMEHYDFLEAKQDHLCNLIEAFFLHSIQHRFASSRYVFDVYVDQQDRVYLIDFNVYGKVTDPLLFSWDELHEMSLETVVGMENSSCIDFRITPATHGIQPHSLSQYRVPSDFMSSLACLPSGGMEEFIAQVREQQDERELADSNRDDDDDDDNDEEEGRIALSISTP